MIKARGWQWKGRKMQRRFCNQDESSCGTLKLGSGVSVMSAATREAWARGSCSIVYPVAGRENAGLALGYRSERKRATRPPKTPPSSEPMIAASLIPSLTPSRGIDIEKGTLKRSRHMITQTAAIMAAHIPPEKTPSTSPSHDLATIPPVMPPTAIAAVRLQCVRTPIEHRTATNRVTRKSDRRLN